MLLIKDKQRPERHQATQYRPLVTLDEIETAMATSPRALLKVSGDCLEGVNVQNGGWVAVDFTRYPAPPRYKSRGGDGSSDLCLCYATYPGTHGPAVMCKEYQGVWGTWQMVGTRYKTAQNGDKLRLNCGMIAKRIFGVITASYSREGQLLWQRDPEEFPKTLGSAPTIHGEVEPA